jgi:hypothetical protein
MENRIKILIYLSFSLLILLGIAAVKSLFSKPDVYSNIERIREIRDDSISYWKDAYGREHAQKEVAQSNFETLNTVYKPLMDSVLKSLNIQGKQLDNLSVAGVSSGNHVPLKVDTIYKDSSTQYHFSYKDPWISLSGQIGKLSSLDYSTFDSLIITSYQKKTGFLGLGKRVSYIDAYSINPHSHITGLQGIQVATEKPKRFGLGPYVGYGWNGQQWAPNIGIGINYSILKF